MGFLIRQDVLRRRLTEQSQKYLKPGILQILEYFSTISNRFEVEYPNRVRLHSGVIFR